ncbi:MAG: cytochrome c [Alphaproteobacteria bacterium]
MNKIKLGVIAALAMTVAGVGTVAALDNAQSIATRKALMGSVGAHMASLKEASEAGNAAAAERHANTIARLLSVAAGLFPKGSGPEAGTTKAKPDIWAKWDDFNKAGANAAAAATAAAAAAKTGDKAKMMAAFGDVGKGCGGCHTPFRAQ